MACAVSLDPPPVMILARPAATLLPTSTRRIFSGSVSVDVSPVVPVTTMPSAPAATTSSMCCSTPGQSTSPSAVIGVTSATSTCPNGLSAVTRYRLSAPTGAARPRAVRASAGEGDEAVADAAARRVPPGLGLGGGRPPFRAALGSPRVALDVEVELGHHEPVGEADR